MCNYHPSYLGRRAVRTYGFCDRIFDRVCVTSRVVIVGLCVWLSSLVPGGSSGHWLARNRKGGILRDHIFGFPRCTKTFTRLTVSICLFDWDSCFVYSWERYSVLQCFSEFPVVQIRLIVQCGDLCIALLSTNTKLHNTPPNNGIIPSGLEPRCQLKQHVPNPYSIR